MNLVIGVPVLVKNVQKSPVASHIKACVLFSNSAVKVEVSEAYINIEMTRERISFTYDTRDMLLSL